MMGKCVLWLKPGRGTLERATNIVACITRLSKHISTIRKTRKEKMSKEIEK